MRPFCPLSVMILIICGPEWGRNDIAAIKLNAKFPGERVSSVTAQEGVAWISQELRTSTTWHHIYLRAKGTDW